MGVVYLASASLLFRTVPRLHKSAAGGESARCLMSRAREFLCGVKVDMYRLSHVKSGIPPPFELPDLLQKSTYHGMNRL